MELSKPKQLLALILSVVLATSMLTSAPQHAEAASFPDVPKKSQQKYYETWYAVGGYVDFVADRSIMTGYEDGKFGPNDRLTRGQVAVILYRYDQKKTAETTDNKVQTVFSDVKSGKFYAAAVKWANEKKIVTGYSGTKKFGPNDHITREQLATMIARYAKTKGKTITASKSAFDGLENKNKVSSYAKKSMMWCTEQGIITGVVVQAGGPGFNRVDLAPQGFADRAQMAKIMTVTIGEVLATPGKDFICASLGSGSVSIQGYKGSSTNLVIPRKINGKAVTSINLGAYQVEHPSKNLTSLDVSNCDYLSSLSCAGNKLTTLDVSKNKELTWLSCPSNKLTSLDISKNKNLKSLYCNDNQIKNTSKLEAWLAKSGHNGKVKPQRV